MKRVFLLLGASTMAVASVAGFSVATATPVAAQTAPPTGGFGYVINILSCVTSPNPGLCINQNVRGLLNSFLGLFGGFQPSQPSASRPAATPAARPTAPRPTAPGSNAPTLNLPSNITGFLRTMPPALRTTPVADAQAPTAGLTQLVPAPTRSRGLSTTAPRVSLPSASNLRSLPKLPTATDISLFNISDSAPAADSGSPISGGDLMMLVGLGAAGAAAVTAATRRRAAAAHS